MLSAHWEIDLATLREAGVHFEQKQSQLFGHLPSPKSVGLFGRDCRRACCRSEQQVGKAHVRFRGFEQRVFSEAYHFGFRQSGYRVVTLFAFFKSESVTGEQKLQYPPSPRGQHFETAQRALDDDVDKLGLCSPFIHSFAGTEAKRDGRQFGGGEYGSVNQDFWSKPKSLFGRLWSQLD